MNEGRATLLILGLCALLWAGIVLRNSSENLGNEIYERTVSVAQVHEAAKAQLAGLQEQSFIEDTEFCGLLAENADGEIVSRTVMVGDHESCDISWFDVRTLYPLATYHTHAGFNPRYDSEVPSELDIRSDMQTGLDGYVATPGGRLWHVNAQSGTARQLCGANCLPSDPRYRACNAPPPEESYTIERLGERGQIPWAGC